MMESKKEKLTQKRLKELLDYDPETGIFKRILKTCNSVSVGDIAGGICSTHGYNRISVDGVRYRGGRLAWLYMEGYMPCGLDVDHKNKIRHCDKWNNLRIVNRICNIRNSKISNANRTGVTGASIHPNGKFFSYIKLPNRKKHLGYFSNMVNAVKARWKAEKKYNWPNCQTSSSAYLYLKEKGLV